MATSDPPRTGQQPPSAGPRLALSQVIDHALLDRNGRRAGRVDDLDLEVGTDKSGGTRIVLRGIVSGPLPRPAPRGVHAVARACYRFLGVTDPHPVHLPWQHVTAINVFVRLDVARDEAGLDAVDAAVRRRFARHRRRS